jgi:1-phosphatidylinositol-3-phosphate 5-kinase
VYAPAKVKVLDSVKEAIADDSESSDSSSEADDEADGNDEERPISPTTQRQPLNPDPATSPVAPEPIPEPPAPPTISETPATPPQVPINLDTQEVEKPTRLPHPGQITLPSSPFLKNVKSNQEMVHTPPTSDSELGSERLSFLRALSVFWQQPTRNSIEADDPMNDPEHIFRDSSMVVRLDEPTSIIALALK